MANSTGIVISLKGDTALVDATDFKCEGCTHSEGCTLHSSPVKKEVTADINGFNDIKTGDRVEIEISEEKLLFLSFLIYLVPVILFVVPLLLVYRITMSDMISALAGLSGLAVSFIIIFLVNRYQKKQFKHIIVRVLK